jgi:hypothetical protein
MESMKHRWHIPGLGGFAYMIDVAECDPTRYAIAVGDNTIRVRICL